jgi:hypothetical protein
VARAGADEIVETLLRRRDRWAFTYTVVPDDAMEHSPRSSNDLPDARDDGPPSRPPGSE